MAGSGVIGTVVSAEVCPAVKVTKPTAAAASANLNFVIDNSSLSSPFLPGLNILG
jgi:hypothetical protein